MTGLRRIPNTTLIDGEKIDNLPTDTNASLAAKQDTLVSGKNIKTVGGKSLLGSGDISIPTYSSASKTVAGVVKLGDNTVQTVAGNNVSSAASRSYKVQVNAAGEMLVNVPWTDTDNDTTYSTISEANIKNASHTTGGLITGQRAEQLMANEATKARTISNKKLGNDLDANSKKITNLATPTNNADAATKKYVDDNAGGGSGDMLASTYDPNNIADDAFSMDNMVEGSTNKIMTDAERTKLSGIATQATKNDTDANLKNRANHTGTQTASTISDFDAAVSSNSAVALNTAKVSNATHTGDVTGATVLTIANGAVTKAKTDSGVQASLDKADTALQSGDIGTTVQANLISGTNIKTVGGTTLLGSGDIDGGTGNIGYKNIPQVSKSANYTLVLGDAGKSIDHPSSDANARTFTIPANSSVAYPVGTTISFSNMSSQVITIAITTDTMYLAGDGATGSRTLAQYGVATIRKLTATTRLISGVGLT